MASKKTLEESQTMEAMILKAKEEFQKILNFVTREPQNKQIHEAKLARFPFKLGSCVIHDYISSLNDSYSCGLWLEGGRSGNHYGLHPGSTKVR